MHFWRKDCFELLKVAASEAKAVPVWMDYAGFCASLERGLRKTALVKLTDFITVLERSPFEERKRFTGWLSHLADQHSCRHMLVPHPLQLRVIEPTLLEWTMVEPSNFEPHLWIGGYEHLRQALELAPEHQAVRRKLIISILSRVSNNAHELPIGYLGAPQEDLSALAEAEAFLSGLSDVENRSAYGLEIKEIRDSINEYVRRRQTPI